jgi:hypothetical protein
VEDDFTVSESASTRGLDGKGDMVFACVKNLSGVAGDEIEISTMSL